MRTIRDSGRALLTILNDMLDCAKIEAGRLGLETEDFDLVELARYVDAFWAPQARAKGLGFRLDLDGVAMPGLMSDRTRIQQILFNLTSNALKFTERGEIALTVRQAEISRLVDRLDGMIGR